MSLGPFTMDWIRILEGPEPSPEEWVAIVSPHPLEYIFLDLHIGVDVAMEEATPLICKHCGGQHASECCSLKGYIAAPTTEEKRLRFLSSEDKKALAEARDAIAQAAIDWADDTDSCHFCSYGGPPTEHADDCPVGEYLKIAGGR